MFSVVYMYEINNNIKYRIHLGFSLQRSFRKISGNWEKTLGLVNDF